MSRTEIEKTIDQMVEQEPDFDQLDLGPVSSQPVARLSDPNEVKPYPQSQATVQWYGIMKCWSRMDQWSKRITMELDTDDPFAAATILAMAGYFSANEAREELERWKAGEENPFFLYQVEESTVAEEDGGIAVTAEEWEGGFGKSPDQAARMFAAVSSPEEQPGWIEV